MKKVVLLGDSIRINYQDEVTRLLGEDYEVFRPDDNCRFSYYLQRMVFDYGDALKADVIHFNAGEWDISDVVGEGPFTPVDVYVDCMVRIAKYLKTLAKTVIFATSTPVNGHCQNSNSDVIKYNAAVVPEMEKLGVVINDLYTPVYADLLNTIRTDDGIHLTEKGIEICSERVAGLIRRYAEE